MKRIVLTTLSLICAFAGAQVKVTAYKQDETQRTIPAVKIDSLTFSNESVTEKISITYNETAVSVVNPYADEGISITTKGAQVFVTANSGIFGIEYSLSGNSANGSLSIQSDKEVILHLNNLTLASLATPAIEITGDIPAQINLSGNNTLSDAAANGKNAALSSRGALRFAGSGFLQLSGLSKHAVSSEKEITVEAGNIRIVSAKTDGFHSKGFVMNNGSLAISALGDGTDAGRKTIGISGGTVQITSASGDVKAIKCDGILTIDGGNITIQSTSAALGGKGISAGNTIIINGGNINITTAGNGSAYANASGTTDSYTACCIKNSTGKIILMYNVPVITGASSGAGVILVLSDPQFVAGSYTLAQGGTISGGTTVNGYNTGGTYSGGTIKSFTIGSSNPTIVQ